MNDIQLFLTGSQQLKRETTEDGFILIFTRCADRNYTLGWKKEICGSLCGDWIWIKTDEDSEAVYERFKGAVLEQARVVERTIVKEKEVQSHGRKGCQKSN